MLPSPCGVLAALALVVGVGFERGHQESRIAVGPQGCVDFVQIAIACFNSQPVDEFAHIGRVNFAGAFVRVFVHKHDVQVAAIAQFFAAQFAVGEDGKEGLVAVALFEVLPYPAAGDSEHTVCQSAQVVCHLFNGDASFHIARQGAEHFGMVCATQEV